MKGFFHFSGSDDPWDDNYPLAQIRCSFKLQDDLRDNLLHDGLMLSYTYDDREWVGVEEQDGRGYVEVVTDVGEGYYVSIYFEGLDGNSEIIKTLLRSFQLVWN